MSRTPGGYLTVSSLQSAAPIRRLPLVTLYLTERCNSRCVTCDYWRHGRLDMGVDSVRRLLPSLRDLGTQVALLSGGEPLLNPQWREIAALLRGEGLQLWLLTSGLALAKHAAAMSGLFEAVTVSMDGTDAQTYASIRGVNAFSRVCEGIRAAVATGLPVSLRVTIQRANYTQIPGFVELARALGAQQVSFVAVDVANPHAFARGDDFGTRLALEREDIPVLERVLRELERDYADAFRSGLIAESPRRMRHIHQYFAALCGLNPFPPVRCNAPEFSAVISARRTVSPCFFIPGPDDVYGGDDLSTILNGEAMTALRARIRAGGRSECATCVCSLWRDGEQRSTPDFLLRRRPHA